MKTFKNPENIHAPIAAYTHQIEVSGQTRWLVLSGQIGKDKDGDIPDDPIKQLEIAVENIIENLHAANMDIKDLVKVVFYLVGNIDAAKRREIISRVLYHKPCMTTLYVASLADPSLRVEIDAWACSEE